METPILALIFPCYNEEEVFSHSFRQIKETFTNLIRLGSISDKSFLLFVDDGSRDQTWQRIVSARSESPGIVRGLKLSRNFGHQFAVFAGLEFVVNQCDISISMDVDLQDDVNALPIMIDHFKSGSDVVLGVRSNRESDKFFKRNSAKLFYKLINSIGVEIKSNVADFRLLSKRATIELIKYREQDLFLRGIVPSIGFLQTTVESTRNERKFGTTKYSLRKMISLALRGVTSQSVFPLRIVFYLGILLVFMAALLMLSSLYSYYLGKNVEGWTSLFVAITLFGGIQMLSLGVFGEYLGKLYFQSKNRPMYIIEDSF